MLKRFKGKTRKQQVGMVVLALGIVALLGVSGYRYYQYWGVPNDELPKRWRIDDELKLIKLGRLNEDKWTIVQYEDHLHSELPAIKYKNRSGMALPPKNKENTFYGDAKLILGKEYAVTYNMEELVPQTDWIDEKTREYQTVFLELVVYQIDDGAECEPTRLRLITPDRQMLPMNYEYYIKGFTAEDKYLVIQGTNDSSSTFYYLEMYGKALKREEDVEEEERYQEPDEASNAEYEKYYSEEIQGKADLWPDTSAPRVYLEGLRLKTDQPNEQNRFIQKYPEIKEYYGKGTYIIINYADHDFTQEELIEDLRSGYVTD